MAHPIRIYCAGEAPPASALLAAAAARGTPLVLDEEFADVDPAARGWDALGFRWRPDRPAIHVELERPDGPDARRFARDLGAARRALDALPASPARDEARARLRAARFVAGLVVAPEDGAWVAADALATAFEQEARGLAWVLGQGFFLDGAPLAS